MVAMESVSRPTRTSVSKMATELADCLKVPSNESATQSSSGLTDGRIRTLLTALLSEGLEIKIGKENEVAKVLQLITIAVKQFPAIVSGDNCSAIVTMLQALLPTFALERYKSVHSAALSTVVTLVTLLADRGCHIYAAYCKDVVELTSDAYQALKILVALTGAATKATVTLQGFCSMTAGEADSVMTGQKPLCNITVTSMMSSQLLCSMALEMLAHNLRASPMIMMQYISQEMLLTLFDLVMHGGFSLQASALNVLAPLLSEMPLELIPLETCSRQLLLGLETWTMSVNIAEVPPAFQLWQQHMLTCLNILTGMLDTSTAGANAAQAILQVLPRLVCSMDHSQDHFAVRLCHVPLDIAVQHPQLSHLLSPMLSLIALPGSSGKAASQALYLMLLQLQRAHPQHPIFDLQTHNGQQRGKHTGQASQPSQQEALAMHSLPACWQPALAAMEAMVAETVPVMNQQTVMRAQHDSQLQSLSNALLAVSKTSAAGLTAKLGPVLGQWVQHVTHEGFVHQLSGTLIGVVTAFAGTCVAQATAAGDERNQCLAAGRLFGSCQTTGAQLQSLVSMPWLHSSTSSGAAQLFAASQPTNSSQPQTAVTNQAKVNALLLQAALPLLGFPELASADFSDKQGLQGNFHRALQHSQATVQAAAVALLPLVMANTATASQTASRGHATVGSRLLQKGLDTLIGEIDVDSHSSKATSKIKSASAFALQSLISMQHVMEHRLTALSSVVKHLLYLSPGKGSSQPTSDSTESSQTSALCDGLLCWPPCPVARLSQLSVKGHGGATVPEKAIQKLTGVLLTNSAPAHQQIYALQALLTWASAERSTSAQWLLKQLKEVAVGLRPAVRQQFAREAAELVRPEFLAALYNRSIPSQAQADGTELELRLLAEMKQMLGEKNKHKLEVRETLLMTIAMLGLRMQSPSAHLTVLFVLIGHLGDSDPGIGSCAAELLLCFAAVKQRGLREMVFSMPRLLESVGQNLGSNPKLLEELALLLDLPVKDLVMRLIPAALPKLTEDKNTASIEALAQGIGVSVSRMMGDQGHYVVTKYLPEDFSKFEAIMTFMEGLIGTDYITFTSGTMQRLTTMAMTHVSSSPDWVDYQLPPSVHDTAQHMMSTLNKIANAATAASNAQGHAPYSTEEFLAEGDHITRTLKLFGDELEKLDTDQPLIVGRPDVSDQQMYLRCVLLIVHLSGKYVARFLPQTMVLFDYGLRSKAVQAKLQALEGWVQLLVALAAHAPSHLKTIANQVVVLMLDPLQEGGAVTVAAVAVLEQLVIHSRHLLRSNIKTLPPLPPGIPQLGAVLTVLSEERGSLTIDESMGIALSALADHSITVRRTALQEIRNILHVHRAWLSGLLPISNATDGSKGSGEQSGMLCRLLGALLKCCDPQVHTHASWLAQQLCAECLGLLGAVDPARVELALEAPEALSETQLDLLKTLIIKHLVRLLRVAQHIHVLDAASLAIQELLRHYGMSDEQPAGSRRNSRESTPVETNTLFVELPAEIQDVVRPYLDSKFQRTRSSMVTKTPIFTATMSFRRWLYFWVYHLVTHHASGQLLPLFEACLPVMRTDIQVNRFLLPYLLQDVISFGSEEAVSGMKTELEVVLQRGQANKEGELCVQAVFVLLDVLKKWAEAAQTRPSWLATGRVSQQASGTATQRVQQLLESIPQDLLAQAAAQCGAHARALLHYEAHLRAKGVMLNPVARRNVYASDQEVSFLQEVYGKLEEPDGLAGLVRLRSGPACFQDQLLAAEKAGSWSEALALHEQALQHGVASRASQVVTPVDQSQQKGLTDSQRGYLSCLLHMGHVQGMMTQVDGWTSHSQDTAQQQLAASRVAAAWRLGHWEVLEGAVAATSDHLNVLSADERWEVRTGKMLSAVHHRKAEAAKLEIAEARAEIMAPLSAASMESYSRAYPHLIKLHMLQELSDSADVLAEGSLGPLDRQRHLRWTERLQVTQPSLSTQEPILAVRRQLAVLSNAEAEAGHCWLQHAKLCRVSGHFEAAMTASLEALHRQVPGAELQHAKLLWDMDKPHRAIISLQEILRQNEGRGPGSGAQNKHAEAKLALQLASWMAATGQGAKTDITGLFEQAIGLDKNWEKGYFRYAVYLDQLMRDARQRQSASTATKTSSKPVDRLGGRSRIPLGEDQPHLEILPEVIRNYGLAVQHGHRHIFQSLPRLLTLWFDFGTHIKSIPATQKNRQVSTAVANIMASLAKLLPSYAWLTALPQLISRICHVNPEVNTVTNHIITHVAEAYPQQALWALAAVQKSLVTGRKQAAGAVMNTLKKHCTKSYNRKLYEQFPGFCDQLIRLCNHQPASAKAKFFSAKADFSTLVRSLPLDIMMPVNSGLTLTLPTGSSADKHVLSEVVTIAGIKDEIELLPSLQKPKKVDMIGSDGKIYRFLAKPKDDLRKDNRMMEVASILNGLFTKDPASRRRNLLLRRFAVVPLTEETGIIEWVPNTHGLRHCCQDIYIADGTYDKRTINMTVKKQYDAFTGKRKAELLDKLLGSFSPVLHRWFLARFPEPATWHHARLTFTSSTAVWSMVGHIVGLGDRHGENILLDATTGDCVHVDFAFLFDRGLTLTIPEMVPFRLTQNLVDAFGVSGIEGVFRRACEVTLQVLRTHKDTLLSILETLVHDPLVEWVPKNAKSHADEQENAMARDAMATIEGRLTGTLLGVTSTPSLPLSAEGQAHRLIEEATDKNNLGEMYIWWMPWL